MCPTPYTLNPETLRGRSCRTSVLLLTTLYALFTAYYLLLTTFSHLPDARRRQDPEGLQDVVFVVRGTSTALLSLQPKYRHGTAASPPVSSMFRCILSLHIVAAYCRCILSLHIVAAYCRCILSLLLP